MIFSPRIYQSLYMPTLHWYYSCNYYIIKILLSTVSDKKHVNIRTALLETSNTKRYGYKKMPVCVWLQSIIKPFHYIHVHKDKVI